MRCRTFLSRSLLLGGCLVFLTQLLPAETSLQAAYDAAKKRHDWSTIAETAIRWLEKDPNQHALMGSIAAARLHQSDLQDCAKWLARWEASVDQPTAEMFALRGELALANQNLVTARASWEQSYKLAPSQQVARRLTDPDLWSKDERTVYESMMIQVCSNYHFVQAIEVANEAAIRERNWERCQEHIKNLNELGTQSGMSAAATFEAILEQRPMLAQQDAAIAKEETGLSYARRADFFRSHRMLQLAIEDARNSRSLAPRMVLPRITLALCLAARGQEEELSDLRVVVKNKQALIDKKARSVLDKLDHAASQSIVEPHVFLDRAVALASANQPYLALDDLKLAGPALKNSTKGWICVGHCRAVTDNTEGAQQAFEEALKHDANSPEAWEALADLAMERADYPQAIRRLTWLVDHKPDSHQFSKQLAIAKARLH